MRSVLILGLIAFLAAAGFGIYRNPRACEKLALDLASDTLAIYVTPAEADSKDAVPEPDAAPASSASGNVVSAPTIARPLSPEVASSTVPKLPVVAPAAPALPVVTPVTVTPVTAPAPAAAPVPATPKPQYAVGYVAAAPATATPIPQPAPLPAASPTRAVAYPTFTDYSAGLQAARKYHVPMLVLFTGSDWCQYCQMLEREVLSSSDFTKFSSTHFVFVTIDDLRNSPVLDDDKQRISGLEQKFNITGFPTLVVVDENEKELDRVEGYDPGSGPEKVIKDLTPHASN